MVVGTADDSCRGSSCVGVGEYAGLESLVNVFHEWPLAGFGIPATQHLLIPGHTDTSNETCVCGCGCCFVLGQ